MRTVLIIFLLTYFVGAFAQDQVKSPDSIRRTKKLEYFFLVQSGALIGCFDCSLGTELSYTAATIQGVKIGKRLRLGGGLGYDSYYSVNTVPLFGSASWDIFSKQNAFFVQINYGRALKSWKNSQYDGYGYQESEGGRMVNPMVGYRLRYHNLSLALMAGYKYQRVTSSYEYPYYYWDPVTGQVIGETSTSTLIQEINRFVLSMSIGWK